MKIRLVKPLDESFVESLLNKDIPENARRVLGVLVVLQLQKSACPPDVLEAVKQVYREYYPGMFPDQEPTACLQNENTH